jgi:hypothetical protein
LIIFEADAAAVDLSVADRDSADEDDVNNLFVVIVRCLISIDCSFVEDDDDDNTNDVDEEVRGEVQASTRGIIAPHDIVDVPVIVILLIDVVPNASIIIAIKGTNGREGLIIMVM